MTRLILPPSTRITTTRAGCAAHQGDLVLRTPDGDEHLLAIVEGITWDGSALVLTVEPLQTREDQGQMFSALSQRRRKP